MKRLLFLIVIVAAVFIIFNRHSLYLRDPLGNVSRNGVAESGAQVYINFDNEVLLENDNAPMYVTLIQKRSPQEIGTPVQVRCMHHVACLTDADIASLAQPAQKVDISQMTGKLVEYRDADGKTVQITLR